MSGGTAYVRGLQQADVNQAALATGELVLGPMDSADVAILRDLLERHIALTGSALAGRLLDDFDASAAEFVKVMPRDYAAVLETRARAADEGLDPDGDVVWNRILEVTGG
jgi:glutamate synthase (NADPH/NADH) large chain